jgi:hypothetical protein
MPRKKQPKTTLRDLKKKPPFKKRVQLKYKKSDISDLFDLRKTLYYSGFALTDNYNVILFFINNKFLEKNNLTNKSKEFNLNEDDLKIQFNKKKPIRPDELEETYIFDEIGQIKKEKLNWFKTHYPKCAFYQINKWFDKDVNTLIIILDDKNGRPVAVVKTHN